MSSKKENSTVFARIDLCFTLPHCQLFSAPVFVYYIPHGQKSFNHSRSGVSSTDGFFCNTLPTGSFLSLPFFGGKLMTFGWLTSEGFLPPAASDNLVWYLTYILPASNFISCTFCCNTWRFCDKRMTHAWPTRNTMSHRRLICHEWPGWHVLCMAGKSSQQNYEIKITDQCTHRNDICYSMTSIGTSVDSFRHAS